MKCEGWRKEGGAFSLGPVTWEQCKNDATVMIKLQQEGEVSTLPGCQKCWKECIANKEIKVVSVASIV